MVKVSKYMYFTLLLFTLYFHCFRGIGQQRFILRCEGTRQVEREADRRNDPLPVHEQTPRCRGGQVQLRRQVDDLQEEREHRKVQHEDERVSEVPTGIRFRRRRSVQGEELARCVDRTSGARCLCESQRLPTSDQRPQSMNIDDIVVMILWIL